MQSETALVVCDPYKCIAKKNRKYAFECTEVYLNNLGAEELSDNFKDFGNLETAWLSGNRLSRLENLESNFRIQELYLQDNRIVSLAGLKTFKFLRVLLASNNQLRNLDKQLALLTRFAFLKKLDLFDNPVAEEPDYRLRLIYHVPQVEILDRHAVKGPERSRADEVVPNLDKASAPSAEKSRKKQPWASHSEVEKHCFRTAKAVAERKRREEDEGLGQTCSTAIDLSVAPPIPRTIRQNRDRWESLKMTPKDNLQSNAHDVLKVCVDALHKPEPYALTLKRHLQAPCAKVRGDVFHQTRLVSKREADDFGKHSVRVRHETTITPIGG